MNGEGAARSRTAIRALCVLTPASDSGGGARKGLTGGTNMAATPSGEGGADRLRRGDPVWLWTNVVRATVRYH